MDADMPRGHLGWGRAHAHVRLRSVALVGGALQRELVCSLLSAARAVCGTG